MRKLYWVCNECGSRLDILHGVTVRTACIGIDFDNTIVDYDDLFVACAVEAGLLDAAFHGGKTAVRDAIRALPDGNVRWTELQARVYGAEIERALPFAGFEEFLSCAARSGARLTIISQKTRFAAADRDGIDLRAAASAWLSKRAVVEPLGPISAARVYFEDERRAKLERISAAGCTHFIDDLAEIFADPAFPRGVARYHFTPAAGPQSRYPSWNAISDAIFGRS